MLEYVKQKLHDVRENKTIMFACKNQSKSNTVALINKNIKTFVFLDIQLRYCL